MLRLFTCLIRGKEWGFCMFAWFIEWDVEDEWYWSPGNGSRVPGQHTHERDGQGRSAHPHQRRGASLPSVLVLSYEPAQDLTFFFYCSHLPTRSSPKRLRSTNGRGSMRRPEQRFLRWGTVVLLFTWVNYYDYGHIIKYDHNICNINILEMFLKWWNGVLVIFTEKLLQNMRKQSHKW